MQKKKNKKDDRFTTDNPSIFVTIQNLRDLTRMSAWTCIKYKQDILAKCGKEKNEKLTIGDLSLVSNIPVEILFKMMYPG